MTAASASVAAEQPSGAVPQQQQQQQQDLAQVVAASSNGSAMVEMDSSTVIGKGKVGTHEFMMYEYKIALCPRSESHVWEKCLYAHRGERARRRHPSKYQAVQCPEARAKKSCPRGDDCNCTHHLFEYWLHPDRYMTCLCELGPACNRPICFFAHHASELRPLPPGLSHPEEDAFPSARAKERQQKLRGTNDASGSSSTGGGGSNSPMRQQQPGSSSSGGCDASFVLIGGSSGASRTGSNGKTGTSSAAAAPPAVAVVSSPTVTVVSSPDLSGAFRALELLSVPDTAAAAAAAAGTSGQAAADGVPRQLLQQHRSADLMLQNMSPLMLASAATAAGAVGSVSPPLTQSYLLGPEGPEGLLMSQAGPEGAPRQRASSAPTLLSSNSFNLLGQQLMDPLQQQLMLSAASRQGSVTGSTAPSSCSGNSGTALPGMACNRAMSSGLSGPELQAVRTSLELHAVRTARSLSGGYSSPVALQVQQMHQMQQLQQQQQAAAGVSNPNSGCSSPLGLSRRSLSPVGTSPMSVANGRNASMNPSMGGMSPVGMGVLHHANGSRLAGITPMLQALSSAMLNPGVSLPVQQQQQQRISSVSAVMADAVAVQQQLHAQQGGTMYYAVGSPQLQQQMMPVQLVDEPPEHLSFSLWGPDGTYLIPQQQQQQQQQSSPHQQYVQQQYVQQQSPPQQQYYMPQQQHLPVPQYIQQPQQPPQQQQGIVLPSRPQQQVVLVPASVNPAMAPVGGFTGFQGWQQQGMPQQGSPPPFPGANQQQWN